MTPLKQRLLEMIAQDGPLTVAQYMTICLHDPAAGYYSTRPAIGENGDFITAPETSQMFGELIGLWAAQTFLDLGAPAQVNLIEAGPGSGVLIADLWRASKALPAFRDAIRIFLIEPSAPLRAEQERTLAEVGAHAAWIGDIADAPGGPSIIIGNEVLDCLPIRQFIRTESGWRERLIGRAESDLAFGLSPASASDADIPPVLRDKGEGAVAEIRMGLPAFIADIAARLNAAPGRALLIDYGAPETTGGDTFQAMRAHRTADPLAEPGEADLTAHVDFAVVADLARSGGLAVAGPISQAALLGALGIATRAQALQAARPAKAQIIERQLQRLIGPDQMGELFQAICLQSAELNAPPGFAA